MSQQATGVAGDIGRRDTLRLIAAAVGGAAGVRDGEPEEEFVGGMLGGASARHITPQFLIGDDYDALKSAVTDTPALGLATNGNTYTFGAERDRIRVVGVDILLNYDDYAAAKEATDRYPTVGFTTGGNAFWFINE